MSKYQINVQKRKRLQHKSRGICAVCCKPLNFATDTVDHIIPISQGGANTIENTRLLHGMCHTTLNFADQCLGAARLAHQFYEIGFSLIRFPSRRTKINIYMSPITGQLILPSPGSKDALDQMADHPPQPQGEAD